MKDDPKVFLREENVLREIAISGVEKPGIDREFLDKWQNIINLIAKVIHMPAAIIMQITRDNVDGFLDGMSRYNVFHSMGDERQKGRFYCETLRGRNGLLIENAVGSEDWNSGAGFMKNTAAYFGLPLLWPDDELFGTVCVLDDRAKAFKKEYKDILYELKVAFERELALLYNQQQLVYSAETDVLTSIYNRRKMEEVLIHEFDRAKRYAGSFSVTIMDLNDFKLINDTYGHDAGDRILRDFAQGINLRIRETDRFGRWGGDEFILVCPNAGSAETRQMIARIKQAVTMILQKAVAFSDFCYGVAQFEAGDPNYLSVLKRADESLYRHKEQYKAKADDYA